MPDDSLSARVVGGAQGPNDGQSSQTPDPWPASGDRPALLRSSSTLGLDTPLEQGLSLGERVRVLLARREHADALVLLYRAHEERPHEARISNAIQVLKERMSIEYLEEIGRLDQVPTSTLGPGPRSLDALSVEERIVLQLADGIVTYEDLLAISSLGRLRTLQAVVGLLRRGVLVSAPQRVTASTAGPVELLGGPEAVVFDAEALFRRGMQAYLARDYDVACQWLERCLELDPTHARARHNRDKLKARSKTH